MKTLNRTLLTALASLTLATGASAATITAVQIIEASGSSSDNLGTTSITIGDFTIASTEGETPPNLGQETQNGDLVGVVGGLQGSPTQTGNDQVRDGETITLSFASTVQVSQIVAGNHGNSDGNLLISGFSSDPGATIDDFGDSDTFSVSYFEGTLTIDPAGFLNLYALNFANSVDVTSLEWTTDSLNNGVGFSSITYVPEPGSLALMGLGGLCMLKRRRRV